MQNVCNLEHNQEMEVRQALYKVRLLEFPGANVSQYLQLWRLITGLLIGRGVDLSDGPKAFKRELKTVEHGDFIFEVRSYERDHENADLNTLFTEAIRLFNKHKGTWTIITKAPSVFHTEDNKKAANSPPKRTKMAPGMLETHDAARNPIDWKPPGPGESRTRVGHIHPHWCNNSKHWDSHLTGSHQAWQERFFCNRGGHGGEHAGGHNGGRGGGHNGGRGGRGNNGQGHCGRGKEATSPLHMPQNNFVQYF
jgi:hypothetical protein